MACPGRCIPTGPGGQPTHPPLAVPRIAPSRPRSGESWPASASSTFTLGGIAADVNFARAQFVPLIHGHAAPRSYSAALTADEPISRPLLENFVIMELRKQASWHDEQPRFATSVHRRGSRWAVIELGDGEVVEVEIPRSQTVPNGDRRRLSRTARAGPNRRAPVPGWRDSVSRPEGPPLGKNLRAVPMAAPWEW
jgi:hypothetical protein